eukprot:SAG31_NODE_14012_length_832_cov_0.799454_1_plen_75_part_00
MALYQASASLGIMAGYLTGFIAAQFPEHFDRDLLRWRWPFIGQAFLMLPLCWGCFSVPVCQSLSQYKHTLKPLA